LQIAVWNGYLLNDHDFVSERIARHKAGIRMEYRQTTPEILAQAILKNIGRKMEGKSIPFDGAKKATEIISEHLRRNQ